MSESTNSKHIFRASKLLRDAMRKDVIKPGARLRISRPLDDDNLIGRHEGSAHSMNGDDGALSSRLNKRVGSAQRIAKINARPRGRLAVTFDSRQRAVVKIRYYTHASGGRAALKQHARYLARDSAARAQQPSCDVPNETSGRDNLADQIAKERQPVRQSNRSFYDGDGDSVSATRLVELWAKTDKRHFRIVLSAELGGGFRDPRAFTRDVMARAEVSLATKLQWFAVDHFDTDNAHSHIVLRGVRDDGRDLLIPRDFIQHGFRNAARDAATERLGERTRDDGRRALQREALTHAPTRLDALIAAQLDDNGRIRIATLTAPNGSVEMTDALKTRARELRNLGLAQKERRNLLRFEVGWRDTLKLMADHLDSRRTLLQTRLRQVERTLAGLSQSAPGDRRLPLALGL